jgi:DNA polymerase-3 subunit delta'
MNEAPDSTIAEPRSALRLFGHSDAEHTLLDAYRSGRMPHAWLIGGPPGIGKATLAYRMARFVLANPDPESPVVQSATSLDVPAWNVATGKVASQSHPDLLVMERTIGDTGKLRQNIVIADVKRSVGFFGATAGEGGWRVVIVDSVDELNKGGENAILKILEEPPARALLMLVSHSPGRVLPTIRSRCRRLTLRPLPETIVADAVGTMMGRSPKDDEIKAVASLAEGSIARALALLDEDTLQLRKSVEALLDKLPTLDPRAMHMLGDALGGTDQRAFAAFTDTVNAWLSARLHRGPQDSARLVRLAEAWDRTNRAAAEAEAYNLDRKPVIFSIFGQLAEATAG